MCQTRTTAGTQLQVCKGRETHRSNLPLTQLVSNAEHTDLADRVRALEAGLAAVTAGEHINPSHKRPGPPSLQLNTSLPTDLSPAFSYAGGIDHMSLGDEILSQNVPTIHITGPHGGSNTAPPSALSPSPSLISETSGASSPDPFSSVSAFDFGNSSLCASTLMPAANGFVPTPPLNQWAEVYNQNLHTPTSPGSQHISRRSSVSSFGGLGEAICAMDLHNSDWSMQGSFADSDANDFDNMGYILSDPIPSKPQAEVLAEKVFSNRCLLIDQTTFRVCLEAIYMLPDHTSDAHPAVNDKLSSYTSFSLRVARCLVFLVLTIGLRMQSFEQSISNSNSIVQEQSCYRLAMRQMASSIDFWSENGTKEVMALLGVLAEVSSSSTP